MNSSPVVTLPDYLEAIALPCYPEFEFVMAYGGDMRWVGFKEPNNKNGGWFHSFVWFDGHWRSNANPWPFYLWGAHPKTRAVIGDLGSSEHVGLLLDRVERKLYLFNSHHERDIDAWMELNNTPLHNPAPITWGSLAEAQTKAREFLIWLGNS